ncbi:MAG: hypothetical protein MUC63_02535 [Planctomycetes bacterium]|jgi:hypothetical protein|nr:hypothetical protein [Planctomycetota bacterium]
MPGFDTERAAVPPTGRLSPDRLTRLLTDLFNQRYVGVLQAKDAESAKEFYFAGSGVKLTSLGTRKSLPVGRFWVIAGVLAEDALARTLQIQAEKGGVVGELLLTAGHLTEEQRQAGLVDQFLEELCDVFFWPSPEYHYRPGHQTRVGALDIDREKGNVKSLSIKGDLAKIVAQAKVNAHALREAGRQLGGVAQAFAATPKAKEILFAKDRFTALPPAQRALLPLFAKPRSAAQTIEEGQIPWSRVLSGMAEFLRNGWIAKA